jgi:hypothetical protein
VLDGKHLGEPGSRPVHLDPDRAHDHLTHLGCPLVRQALGPEQEQGLALVDGNPRQGLPDVRSNQIVGPANDPGKSSAMASLKI